MASIAWMRQLELEEESTRDEKKKKKKTIPQVSRTVVDNPVGVLLSASVSGSVNFLVCFGCVGTATGAKEKNGYKSEEKSRNQKKILPLV